MQTRAQIRKQSSTEVVPQRNLEINICLINDISLLFNVRIYHVSLLIKLFQRFVPRSNLIVSGIDTGYETGIDTIILR